MTTETLTIKVTERGARVVRRDIESIGKSANSSQSQVEFLRKAVRSLSVVLSANLVKNYADEYTNLQNRLKLVTNSTQELTNVTNQLFNIANNTRTSFRATGELYARVALASRELGVTQEQTLVFTETLNKAVILSGANAQEATAGIIQLAQGLASGRVQGDELRSVLEQLPFVADLIADELKVTRGELRQLGADGKILSDVVFRAIVNRQQEVADKFAQTVPTISQGFSILRNRAVELTGELDKQLGVSTLIVKGLQTLAENLPILTKIIITTASAWALYRTQLLLVAGVQIITAITGTITTFVQLAATVRSLTQLLALLNAAFMFGPQALVVALAGAAVAIFAFRQEFQLGFTKIIGEGLLLLYDFRDAIEDVSKKISGNAFLRNIPGLGLVANAITLNSLNNQDSRLSREEVEGIIDDAVTRRGDSIVAQGDQSFFKRLFSFDLELPSLKSPELPKLPPLPALGLPNLGSNNSQNIESVNEIDDALQNVLNTTKQWREELDKPVVPTTFKEGFVTQLKEMQEATKNSTAIIGQQFAQIFGPNGSLSTGIANAIGRAIVFGESFTQSIRQVSQNILSQLISSLAQVGINMLLNAAIAKTSLASTTTSSLVAAAATTAAWAPAAAAVSLATFGANAAPATTGVVSTFATTKALSILTGGVGFKEGGFTGNLPTNAVAGVVHGQEYVVNAKGTAQNRSMLEAMNRGEKVSTGSNVNVYINNQASGIEFETRQINETDVEIIARRVVRQDAPSVIASDISNPNSKTSKALNKNTQTKRRRG